MAVAGIELLRGFMPAKNVDAMRTNESFDCVNLDFSVLPELAVLAKSSLSMFCVLADPQT